MKRLIAICILIGAFSGCTAWRWDIPFFCPDTGAKCAGRNRE